ncbi:MAG: hypothetical protein H7A37_06140 [Chlamydiales bacterium]|nr:hypothetical protein [Chlamydiales bacterium]
MAKHSPLKMVDDETTLAEKIEEHPYTKWLHDNSRLVFYVLIATVALIFVVYRWSASSNAQAERNYIEAAEEFNTFEGRGKRAISPATKQEALEALVTILNVQPDLQAKYDGPIAQELLIRQKGEEAAPFADRVFNRTEKNNIPYFSNYGATSLTIANGDTEAALMQSKKLKELMLADKAENDYPYLYAYNLFRIAMLEQQQAHNAEELTAWQELKAFTKLEQNEMPAETGEANPMQPFIDTFGSGDSSLASYIDKREELIK